MGSSGAFPSAVALLGNFLATGEESVSRELAMTAAAGGTSGQLRLAYFTARKSETSTQVRVYTGGTQAAATPSLCKIGIYSIAANGDGTLVASTANDTTLFANTSTAYTRSWSASFAKVAGQRYAIAPLVVSATTMPTFLGSIISSGTEAFVAPAVAGVISSLSDLPASFVAASVSTSGQRIYAAILP